MKGDYSRLALFCAAGFCLLCRPAPAQVLITEDEGGFTFELNEGDEFGEVIAVIADLDGNGVRELAVAASKDDEAGFDFGAVYILFLDKGGAVLRNTKIPYSESIFGERAELRQEDNRLGRGVDVFRDIDGDGIEEILISSTKRTHLVFLNADGTVRETETIFTNNGLRGIFETRTIVDPIPGYPDAAIGILGHPLYFLFPREVGGYSVLGVNEFDFSSTRIISLDHNWGPSVANMDDIDGDGFADLAVGAPRTEQGCSTVIADCADVTKFGIWGSIWILFLNPIPEEVLTSFSDSVNAFIPRHSIIRSFEGSMRDVMTAGNRFGENFVALGDLDNNGISDIAVQVTDQTGNWTPDTWILFLNERGAVEWRGRISTGGGILAVLDDLNGDGAPELVIGDKTFNDSKGAITISFELANVAPQITVETAEAAELGEPVLIEANIRGTAELLAADVSVRPAGSPSDFSKRKMKKLGGRFDFEHTVPAFFLGDGGLEYFISTEEPTGRHPSSGWLSTPTRYPDGITLPNVDQTGSDYELISVPLVLDSTDARMNFEDDLGPYDISEWRLFELDKEVWKELDTREIEIVPGKALALRRSDSNRVVRTASGQTVPTDQPFLIRLERGWNLVGNPFAFDIPLSNLSLASDAPVELWAYDSTWSVETDAMESFAGYAIFHEQGGGRFDTLWVDADLSPSESEGSSIEVSRFASTAERRTEIEALFAQLTERIEHADRALITNLQNYPNPFRHSTRIRYELLEDANSTLLIFDALGRLIASVANESQKAGTHEIVWDGRTNAGVSVSNGMYFYKVTAGGMERSGKLMLIE
jgi:hypothetical protein